MQEDKVQEITKQEGLHALRILKDGKAAGSDQIPPKILKQIKAD